MSHTRMPLVGVFDSGVGGLSILKALHAEVLSHDLLYVADSAHSPYGERADDYIHQRTHRIASHLLAEGASMLVVACNTASAVAASSLRGRWPQIPVVAVEPGIKPAVALTHNGNIGVMATPATLRSEKFKRLLASQSASIAVHLQPCPGLAGQIEHGIHDDPVLQTLIDQFSAPLKRMRVDTVVLGCTHYPFASEQIQRAFGPEVRLVDTANAVARQTARLLGNAPLEWQRTRRVRLQTTGEAGRLARLARLWLPFECEVSHAAGI